jgi:hypothetical protein
MARDKATLLQDCHMPKQRGSAHLAFVCQPLGARIALACFLVVKIRQLDQHNLGGRFQAFDVRGPNQSHAAHDIACLVKVEA